MHIPRRHLNYANVVATFALVFAMSGGALAAKHYLVNSTKQINPKVLKKLKGNAGKTGATGPAGVAGAPGAQGKEGPQGKEGKEGPLVNTLPVGKTLKGHYHLELDGTKAGVLAQGYSYAFPLASAPNTHFIAQGSTPPAECPGTAEDPKAASGNLCVYEKNTSNSSMEFGFESNELGFALFMTKKEASNENFWSIGNWAVTG